MRNNKYQQKYNTPYQFKLPQGNERIIEISDPIYTFSDVMNQIDLKRYFVIKENKTGRKRSDTEILLKGVLFAFMEHGYVSVREIEKLCNGKEMHYLYSQPVKRNNYGRTKEVYGCEDCNGCPHIENCCNGEGNRTIH